MDARVRFTKKMIRQEFLKLLEEKPLDQITVTAICQNAQINRATFYKYYDNPLDLLKKLEEEQLDQLQEQIKEQKAEFFLDTMRIVMEAIKQEKKFFRILLSENGDEEFRNRIYSICYDANMDLINQRFPEMPDVYKHMVFYFIADGSNGILEKWMTEDMNISVDTVISFIRQLISGVMQIQ